MNYQAPVKSFLFNLRQHPVLLFDFWVPFSPRKLLDQRVTKRHPFFYNGGKSIWQNQGIYGQYSVDSISYQDKPMDLSNLLFLRTRERMLLEAQAVDQSLLTSVPNNDGIRAQVESLLDIGDQAMFRNAASIREAYDEDLQALIRLLNVVRDREGEYDFPVAFLTNTMYVCSKNNLTDLINWDNFNRLLLQKIDFIHQEGIAQAAFALNQSEVYDQAVWTALGEAVLARDTLLSFPVLSERWDATKHRSANDFSEQGKSVIQSGVFEHESSFKNAPRDLFFREYATLIELQSGFEGASANGVAVAPEVTAAITAATSQVDPNGELRAVYDSICGLYNDQLAREAVARIPRKDTAYDPTVATPQEAIAEEVKQ